MTYTGLSAYDQHLTGLEKVREQAFVHDVVAHIKTPSWLAIAGALCVALVIGLAGCDGSIVPFMQLPFEIEQDEQASAETGVLFGLAQAEPTTTDDTAPVCAQVGEPATDVQQAMLEAINQYRASNGLNPLVYSKTLEAAADAHAQDLWVRDFFSHTNLDGDLPPDRAMAAGFCHIYVGENIAAGQVTVEQMMDAFQASPSHDANMREPGYAFAGMGVSVDPQGRHYWCQLLAFDVPELN